MNAIEASKIKVGDRVTLYTYAELRALNIAIGSNGNDDDAYYIKTPINVIPAMMPSLGKTLKVKKIGPYSNYPIDEEFDVGPGFYVELEDGIKMDEADGGYYYDMMLIKKIEEPNFRAIQANPGDTVVLWDFDTLKERFGADEWNEIKTPVDIVGDMEGYLGKEVVIDKVKSYYEYSTDIEKDGYCFTIKDEPYGYWYDMECIKSIKDMGEKKEESKMKNLLKQFVKVMAEKYNDWNTPTTGEKIDSILELVHSGYVTADYAAEIIERILSEENC